MFSYEERIKAVKLLIQYDKSYATVIRELGYPSKGAIAKNNVRISTDTNRNNMFRSKLLHKHAINWINRL